MKAKIKKKKNYKNSYAQKNKALKNIDIFLKSLEKNIENNNKRKK